MTADTPAKEVAGRALLDPTPTTVLSPMLRITGWDGVSSCTCAPMRMLEP